MKKPEILKGISYDELKGEKITFRRCAYIDNKESYNFSYVHAPLEKNIGKKYRKKGQEKSIRTTHRNKVQEKNQGTQLAILILKIM